MSIAPLGRVGRSGPSLVAVHFLPTRTTPGACEAHERTNTDSHVALEPHKTLARPLTPHQTTCACQRADKAAFAPALLDDGRLAGQDGDAAERADGAHLAEGEQLVLRVREEGASLCLSRAGSASTSR